MARSLANGDYSLLMAVESSSRPDSWYRTLTDRTTGRLSCDCPPYIFDHSGMRSCPHTRFGTLLFQSQDATARPSAGSTAHVSPLIHAVQQQWPGLRGQWQIEERRDTRINNKPYHVILIRLLLGNGGEATGTIAFSQNHQITQERLRSRVAGWCGYAIAAEVARLGRFPLAGQPPEHFKVRSTGGNRAARQQQTPTPHIGLSDILRIGDQLDLGDGLRPIQRAENTLRLFLGEQLYTQLEQQGFLDVSSARHQDRVYRVRRDPSKTRERRVRIFDQGGYVKDFCIVRAQDVPEADHFLTVFLGLLSDEQATLSVVQSYNVFGPYSDGREQERLPAHWQPRIGASQVA